MTRRGPLPARPACFRRARRSARRASWLPRSPPSGRRSRASTARFLGSLRRLVDLPRLPGGDLALGLFLAQRIGLLHAERELLALAQRALDLLVGELAPLLLGVEFV